MTVTTALTFLILTAFDLFGELVVSMVTGGVVMNVKGDYQAPLDNSYTAGSLCVRARNVNLCYRWCPIFICADRI